MVRRLNTGCMDLLVNECEKDNNESNDKTIDTTDLKGAKGDQSQQRPLLQLTNGNLTHWRMQSGKKILKTF